jgi:hypothetical protein
MYIPILKKGALKTFAVIGPNNYPNNNILKKNSKRWQHSLIYRERMTTS